MKKILLIILLMLHSLAMAQTQKIEVMGMVCAFCAQGIEKSLRSLKQVNDVYVNLDNYFVVVDSKGDKGVEDEVLTNIIVDAGYTVKGIQAIDDSVAAIRAQYEKK
jgi:copper chaperone CopZ